MKYMLIMRDTDEAYEASKEVPFEEILEAMGRYNEELIKAGVMAGGDGLAPPEEGFVVDFSADPPLVTDGPYGETKELFNGFWILEVSSREEVEEWAKRCPLGPGSKLEVRRIPGIDEFPQDNEWVQKEKEHLANAEARAQERTSAE
ncbi:YciI family protein [Leucobacter sp.]